MEKHEINLTGKICPYPVVEVIYNVDKMSAGESLCFLVDDPLAIKSVPEELEDYEDLDLDIKRLENGWEISVERY